MKLLSTKEQELYDLMSDISETCYCAGWLTGLEYSIWDALDNTNFKFGNRIMDQDTLIQIKELSTTLDGWIIWQDDETIPELPVEEWGPVFVTMETWLQMVNTYNSFSITITA